MRRRAPLALLLATATGLGACSSANPQARPPGQPPTPSTITSSNPGGDAADPERAALERLASEPWGFKRDFYRTLQVGLPDWKKWRRVRIWGHPTRASFRYGDDHYAVITVWYQAVEGPDDPDACLTRFLDHATPIAKSFDVKLGPPKVVRSEQTVRGQVLPMLLELVDGKVESLFSSDEYVGAIASYRSWPGTCLVQGFAVTAENHRELAVKVRDRWVSEGAERLVWEKKLKAAPPPKGR